MSLDSQIVVVSGLPRSGTSLLMQMLAAGGLEVVSDHLRAADVDNPRGYFEFERVKQIQKDSSWLPAARGKALKMISQLLYHLPPTERYRVIFMRRNLDEVIASQEKMLQRRNAAAAPRRRSRRHSSCIWRRYFNGWPGSPTWPCSRSTITTWSANRVRTPRVSASSLAMDWTLRP